MTLHSIVQKYGLKNKTEEELQKLIGDSDRGCLNIAEYDFLKGETFIDKARILFKKFQYEQ